MVTDTSKLENIAEDLIAHKLQKAGILVAKPKFDQDGTDLIALLDVKDAAKFCRIQCKGRSFTGSSTSNVSVPSAYATDGFVLLLAVDAGDAAESDLYCFLGREIRANWSKNDHSYTLNLTRSSFREKLNAFQFNDTRVDEIKVAIINVGIKGEFNIMIHAYANITEQPDKLDASATSGPLPSASSS